MELKTSAGRVHSEDLRFRKAENNIFSNQIQYGGLWMLGLQQIKGMVLLHTVKVYLEMYIKKYFFLTWSIFPIWMGL